MEVSAETMRFKLTATTALTITLLLRYHGFAEAPPSSRTPRPPEPHQLLLQEPLDEHLQTIDSPFFYDRLVRDAALAYGLHPDLIHAVVEVESAGDPNAFSSKGAIGLMQLMPETATELGVQDPSDPHQNIFGGARYLRSLLDAFSGDLLLALAAYNAGPGAVARYRGVPPYPETRSYLKRVSHVLSRKREQASSYPSKGGVP